MKKLILCTSIFTLLGTVAAALLYQNLRCGFLLSLSIALGTTAYHLIMRLMVGLCVNATMRNRANCSAWWFRPRAFEAAFYRRLKVITWKKYLPSYNPELFSMKEKTLLEIAQAMCQAEIVHEIIIVLSFVPLALIPRFGAAAVFVITSLLAAGLDLCFVILQRFNRPRILKISRRFGK